MVFVCMAAFWGFGRVMPCLVPRCVKEGLDLELLELLGKDKHS